MKLKYLLSALVLGAVVSANADVVRFHITDPEQGYNMPKTTDYGTNNFLELRRGTYPSSVNKYGIDVISFGSEEDPMISNWSYTWKFEGLEILHPETVAFEFDAPKVEWTNYRANLYLEYKGRAYFVDGTDTSKESGGSIFIEYPTVVNFPGVEWKSAPKIYADAEENYSNVVTFINCSEYTSSQVMMDSYNDWARSILNFSIGGDYPNEATFTVRIPMTLTFKGLTAHLFCNDNSFEDRFNFGFWPLQCFSNISSEFFWRRQTVYARNGDLDVINDVVFASVSLPVARHGGASDLKVGYVVIDGDTIPYDRVADYVNLQPGRFEFDESLIEDRSGVSHQWNATYDFRSLDLTKDHTIQINYKTDLEMNPNMPEWLERILNYESKYSLTCYLDLKYVKLDIDEDPNRLPIDVSKVSFPDCEQTEDGVEALFDNDPNTYCVSSWTVANNRSEPYGSFIDIELEEPIQSVGFAMQARYFSNPTSPTKMRLYCSNDGDEWTLLGEAECEKLYASEWYRDYADEPNWYTAPEKFKYLRWCAIESKYGSLTQTSTRIYWNLAELRFYGK